MKLQTGWVFAALLWAVGARPQGESRQGAVEETSSAPLDEGLKALVSRVSVRLMCAGKDVPDCESSAASCLTEYGLGSDSPPDFEKVCQGKNQLLCYTKISECVDLLSVSPSAGQLLVSEACSGKTTTDCVQDTIQCMSMLGPGSDTLCPPTASESENDTACTANVLKCIELLLPESGAGTAAPPVHDTALAIPVAETVQGPAEELLELTKSAMATTACLENETPDDCKAQVEKCLSFFSFGSPSSTAEPDLSVICGGSVTVECISTASTCSQVMAQAPGTNGDLPSVLCSRLNVADCEFKVVRCLAISSPEPDLSFCADDSNCDAELVKCVEHFELALSTLIPKDSQNVMPEESQSVVPEESQKVVPEETQTMPSTTHSGDPIGFIAEITNNVLVLQMCAGKEEEEPNCHALVEECMFKLDIPPPGFGPFLDNETICEEGLPAETCAKKQKCLVLYKPKPNAGDLLPQEICRDRDVPNCESKAAVCMNISGLAGLSSILTALPDGLAEGVVGPENSPPVSPVPSAPRSLETPALTGEIGLGSSPSFGPDVMLEDFDPSECLEVISPQPKVKNEPSRTTTTRKPAVEQPESSTTRKSTIEQPESSTTRKPKPSTIREPAPTTTQQPESTQSSFPDAALEEEEEQPGAEILCPKGGLECIRRAEACLEKLKPDTYFIREFFSCKAEVGRMKTCMKPAMESLLRSVSDRTLRTSLLEAFPICFEENDFPGIRLCEARTCMEVEASKRLEASEGRERSP